MGNPLQTRRSVKKRATDEQVIEFDDKISSFQGLSEIIAADLGALDDEKVPTGWRESPVGGELRFSFADATGALPVVTGRLQASVDAVCQRCMEPFRLQLDVEPRLALLPVIEQGAEQESLDYEVWELEEDLLRPMDLVEELLVMAMPFSAMHSNMKECTAFSSADEGAQETTRPFAALRAQMDSD